MSPQTEDVVLSVDPLTARAYQEASDEERAQAQSAFEQALADRRERARRQAGAELIQAMRDMSREAERRGLTPEILEQILNEDLSPGTDAT